MTEVQTELGEIDAIVRLKHAYFRLLDTKRFDELGQLLTEDATSSFDSGKLSHGGRQAIVAFLQKAIGRPDIVTMHHDQAFELHGTALYRDEYRKEEGRWRISHTGYDRIFEERRRRGPEVVSFSTMFDPMANAQD
jgi:hypothetical protein